MVTIQSKSVKVEEPKKVFNFVRCMEPPLPGEITSMDIGVFSIIIHKVKVSTLHKNRLFPFRVRGGVLLDLIIEIKRVMNVMAEVVMNI